MQHTHTPQPRRSRLRRLIFGRPLASHHMEHTLLPKLLALPVFASDAISSVAYATQQIILALGAAGLWIASQQPAYGRYILLLSGLIVLLLAIVVISYWQTIFAYPSGGGSYIVSKDNLGTLPGLIAAAALLIDYVLTVSVSIASGAQNLVNIPFLEQYNIGGHLVLLCLLFVALLTLANLRGLKESGSLFALPTYLFVGMCYLMIALGLLGPLIGWKFHLQYVNQSWPSGAEAARRSLGTFGLVVLLRAFANGCSAMTGTEAVSNGIPAFKEPKSRNAALTLVGMGTILGTIFIGVSWLATNLHVVYWEAGGRTAPAVIDQISGAVFGKTGPFSILYVITQAATAGILILAANTSYADFPRLSSILARDRFLPKQLANLGDKLVFNNGILVLGLFAALLIVLKKGNVDALIPLYAIGVFLAFTLSQSGMVVHWWRLRGPRWQRKAIINGVGACATFIVLLDIAAEKFLEGAWAVIILMAILVLTFRKIAFHYRSVGRQLSVKGYRPRQGWRHHVLVLVPSIHRGVIESLQYARNISADPKAVHVATDADNLDRLQTHWELWARGVPLVILHSPYRSILDPIVAYIDRLQAQDPGCLVTIILPEFVPAHWWAQFLHGQTGFALRLRLHFKRRVVVTDVPYHLDPDDNQPEEDESLPAAGRQEVRHNR